MLRGLNFNDNYFPPVCTTGHFFEVMPDDSDPMRRVGAKGSKCVLHISPWGLTLALKVRHAIVTISTGQKNKNSFGFL